MQNLLKKIATPVMMGQTASRPTRRWSPLQRIIVNENHTRLMSLSSLGISAAAIHSCCPPANVLICENGETVCKEKAKKAG